MDKEKERMAQQQPRSFCPSGFKVEDLNPKIYAFIQYYREKLYPEYYAVKHAYLKLDQLRRVHDTLLSFCIEHDWMDNPEDDPETYSLHEILDILARSFFERVQSNDHNINHFVAGDMLEIRYLDTLY